MDSQCPGCFGQAVVTSRLPCAIVESPWRHKHVPFVNIAFLRSQSIKGPQWKHRLDYYGVVFAHLATGRGIKAKDPEGLDSDRWIPHSRCCENPARAKALAGFSRHLSAGFTDLNPAPRGLSLYKPWWNRCVLDTNRCGRSGAPCAFGYLWRATPTANFSMRKWAGEAHVSLGMPLLWRPEQPKHVGRSF